MAVAPSASITTSQLSTSCAESVPTFPIFPSAIRMESPLARGSLQSPVTIVARFTIAVFMSFLRTRAFIEAARYRACAPRELHQAILTLDVFKFQSTHPRVQSAAIRETDNDDDFVRLRCVRQGDGHPVVMPADVKSVYGSERYIDCGAG